VRSGRAAGRIEPDRHSLQRRSKQLLIKFRVPNLFRKRWIALGAAAAALTAGVALAAWIVLAVVNIGPTTISTSTVTNGAIAADSAACTTTQSATWLDNQLDPSSFQHTTKDLCLINTTSPAVSETYALTSANTNPTLAAGLKLRVTTAGTSSTTAGAAALACTFPSISADGTTGLGAQTQVYFGPLNGFAVGDPAQGSQAGDRTLNTTTTKYEKLCFDVMLPSTADPSLAGLSNAFTLTVTASP